MEIIIKGSEKEIANLILTMQGQQSQKSVTITNRFESLSHSNPDDLIKKCDEIIKVSCCC